MDRGVRSFHSSYGSAQLHSETLSLKHRPFPCPSILTCLYKLYSPKRNLHLLLSQFFMYISITDTSVILSVTLGWYAHSNKYVTIRFFVFFLVSFSNWTIRWQKLYLIIFCLVVPKHLAHLWLYGRRGMLCVCLLFNCWIEPEYCHPDRLGNTFSVWVPIPKTYAHYICMWNRGSV